MVTLQGPVNTIFPCQKSLKSLAYPAVPRRRRQGVSPPPRHRLRRRGVQCSRGAPCIEVEHWEPSITSLLYTLVMFYKKHSEIDTRPH